MEGSREAEMIVQFGLQGITYTVRLAGAAAVRIAALLSAIVNKPNETPGKTRLSAMMNSGEPLDYFTVPADKLSAFAELTKKYGVQYCVATSVNGEYDLIVKRSNAPMINRISEQLGIGTVEGVLTQDVSPREAAQAVSLSAAQQLMDDMLSPNRSEKENPNKELEGRAPSDSSFVSMGEQKTSVKSQIQDYKLELDSAKDLYATARALRESMTSNLPDGMDPVIVDIGWARPIERYNENGERLYRGKTVSEMNEKDKVQWLVDDAMEKHGMLPEETIHQLYLSGWRIDENGEVDELKSKLDTREKRMIMDMMRSSDRELPHLKGAQQKLGEVLNNGNR